jgi:hypothetical protein
MRAKIWKKLAELILGGIKPEREKNGTIGIRVKGNCVKTWDWRAQC